MVQQDVFARAAELRREREQAARNRLATPTNTVAVAAPEKKKSRFLSIIDKVTPEPLEKGLRFAGDVYSEIDRPLSDRLGIDAHGPLDFVLDELTRPTNALIALGGAGAATRLSTLGRAGRLAGGVIAPVSAGGGLGQRFAAEATLATAARGGGKLASDLVPEDAPTSVKVAAGIAGGLAGGLGGIKGVSSVTKKTLGKDLLALAPQPVRASQRSEFSEPAVGNLIKARTVESMPKKYTWSDVREEAIKLEKASSSVTVAQSGMVKLGERKLGKIITKETGSYIKDARGVEQPVSAVLEFPDRYNLTPKQREGVMEMVAPVDSIYREAELFGKAPQKVTLEEGQQFFPRLIDEAATKKRLASNGGLTLSGAKLDKKRIYPTVEDGIADGIVYAPPLAAFEEYTQSTLKEVRDSHISELTALLGEDYHVRVPKPLAEKHAALTSELGSLRSSLRILDTRYSNAISAYMNAAVPDVDKLKQTLADVQFKTGRAAGLSPDEIRDKVAIVKEQLDTLAPEMRRAVREAKELPAGRARVGDISRAPLLKDLDFEEGVAKRITEYYAPPIPPTTALGKGVKAAKDIQGNIVPVRAMGDMSAMLNQLGIFLWSNPKTFVKNAAKAMRDVINPTAYEQFIAEQVDAISHGVVVLGRSSDKTEFQFGRNLVGSWLSRTPGLAQLQRHFEVVTTRNRIDIYNSFVDIAQRSGRPLSDVDKDEIARSLNRFSGISSSKPTDAETLSEFAASFMRSGIETVYKAATDGTLEGSLARQYLRNMVYAGQFTAFGVAAMQGRDPSEVTQPFDTRALKRGELRLNSNFGTVRVAGQDVSLYGRWDSLARLAVTASDSVMRSISEKDATQLFDAVGYLASTKGSPLVTLGYDQFIRGADFQGDEPLSLAGATNQLLPFTVSGFVQDMRNNGGDFSDTSAYAGAALNFFGGKARELTPLEQLDEAARTVYKKSWDDLSGAERQTIEESLPELKKKADKQTERQANQGNEKAKARIENERIDKERIENERQAYIALQTGQISPKQFSDALNTYAYRAAKEKEKVTDVLDVKYNDQKGAKAALSAWYTTYKQSEVAPDVPDFDLQAILEAELMARIDAGTYGDPAIARELIDNRRKAIHAPEVEEFYAAREYIENAGYYDANDEAYALYRKRVSSIVGQDIPTYGAMLVARNKAVLADDTRQVAVLERIINAIGTRASNTHKRMRLQDKQLDEALRMTGRVTKAIR